MEETELENIVGSHTDLSKNERGQRNYESAEGYLNKSLRLYESNKEQFHTGTIHYVGFKKELEIYDILIIVYRDADNKGKMLNTLAKAESIAENNELDQTEKNQYASILRSVGRSYLHQAYDFDKAVKFNNKALKVNTERR